MPLHAIGSYLLSRETGEKEGNFRSDFAWCSCRVNCTGKEWELHMVQLDDRVRYSRHIGLPLFQQF